jgi:TetR/AcrR family transcriptional repressor of nem operon
MSKADQTKAFIIEKIAPIVNRKGYAGTSLSDMTEATGLTKGSIYGNFSGKDEVALAAFDHNLSLVGDILRSEMSRHASIKDKLLAYVNVYNDYLKHPFPEGGCPILNTAIEADDTHPLLKQKASDAITAWKNKLIRLIETGIKTKELKAVADPEQVALTIIATIEGCIMISQLTGKANYRKLILSSVEQMIRDL